MADLTQEVFDTLPGAVKDDYELSGEVYVTKDSLKVDSLKASLDNLDVKLKGKESELAGLTSAEADKIAAAEKAAYDKAVADNDYETINKKLQEQIEDANRRAGESELKYQERLGGIAKDKELVIVSEISQSGTDTGKGTLKRLLKGYVKVDAETGAETYLNDDGSASSLNKQQFIESLKTNDLFKPLLKADVSTTGGGNANGSNGNGSAFTKENTAAKTAKNNGDSLGFLNAHFKEALKR